MAGKLSIGTAWAEAAAFLRKERRVLAPLVLGLITVPATISALVSPNVAMGQIPEPGAWVAVAIIAFLVSLAGQLAIMRLAMGWEGSVGEAIRLAWKRLLPVVGALLIFGVLYALAATPVLIAVGAATGGDQAQAAPVTALVVLIALALLPRFLPLTAIAMEEPRGPWSLLKRAFALTRGNYWRLFAFLLTYLLLSRLLGLVVTITIGSAAAVLIGPPAPMTVSRLVVALALGLVQGALGAVFAAMMGRIGARLIEGSAPSEA